MAPVVFGQDLIDRRTPEIAMRQIGIARAVEFQHVPCAIVSEEPLAIRVAIGMQLLRNCACPFRLNNANCGSVSYFSVLPPLACSLSKLYSVSN